MYRIVGVAAFDVALRFGSKVDVDIVGVMFVKLPDLFVVPQSTVTLVVHESVGKVPELVHMVQFLPLEATLTSRKSKACLLKQFE